MQPHRRPGSKIYYNNHGRHRPERVSHTYPCREDLHRKAVQNRFNEPILYRGVNPNLVKISAKDTGGKFSVFAYEGFAKIGPPLHMHLHQDEVF